MEIWDVHTLRLIQSANELRYTVDVLRKGQIDSEIVTAIIELEITGLLTVASYVIGSAVHLSKDSVYQTLVVTILERIERQVVHISEMNYHADLDEFYNQTGDVLSDAQALRRVMCDIAVDKGLLKEPVTLSKLLKQAADSITLVVDEQMKPENDSMPVIKRPIRRDN